MYNNKNPFTRPCTHLKLFLIFIKNIYQILHMKGIQVTNKQKLQYNRALQLNWVQLYQIAFEAEKCFADDEINSLSNDSFSIRAASVGLLETIFYYINEEKVISAIDSLLQQFSGSILTGNTPFEAILQREAFYFIVFGLFNQIKNSLEFETWYESVLSSELQQEDPKLNPLKIQILNLIGAYVENSYRLDENQCQVFGQHLTQVIANPNNNLYLRLLAFQNLMPLLNTQQMMGTYLEKIMPYIFEIGQQCVENQSKLLIMTLIEKLISKQKQKLSPYMKSIFNYIKSIWSQLQNIDTSNSSLGFSPLSLKQKISTVLKQIINVQQELFFQEIDFYYQVIYASLDVEQGFEIFLIEECGLTLLYQFIISYNQQISQLSEEQKIAQKQVIQNFEQKFLIFLDKIDTPFLQSMESYYMCLIIIMQYIINFDNYEIQKKASQLLIKGVECYNGDMKEDIYVKIYDIIEIFLIKNTIAPPQSANEYQKLSFNLAQQVIDNVLDQAVKQQKQQEDNIFQKLSILRILGRVFFQNLEAGQNLSNFIKNKIDPHSDFIFDFLNESSKHLEQYKPDLCFYKYHCVLSLAYLQILQINNSEDNLIKLFQNISLDNQQDNQQQRNIDSKCEHCFQKLSENYKIIQQYYNYSIHDDTPWILQSLDDLIIKYHQKNQEKYLLDDIEADQQQIYLDLDIKSLYNNKNLLKFLKQDQLLKYNFILEGKNFFQKFANYMPTNLQQRIAQFFSEEIE
ncbi:hypothetical protein PPERSA_12471 [Pseudocohnilembus persalinus]|uniref:Armadillo-type fold n=1 Tax=Pseudocohnilembus persalinus TaxID=266149 RepID=A0A0V0QPN6_PSEPJ|nr:hypothetical protein PPERSA_12471 [Pseudocohnilembus persalinus]|eukprot:KRX04024.1 hypothetical protein PPERSA_12471 [Pseudocohnilembus persalinus]